MVPKAPRTPEVSLMERFEKSEEIMMSGLAPRRPVDAPSNLPPHLAEINWDHNWVPTEPVRHRTETHPAWKVIIAHDPHASTQLVLAINDTETP